MVNEARNEFASLHILLLQVYAMYVVVETSCIKLLSVEICARSKESQRTLT